MANPYQFLNPLGAGLVGLPDAYRREQEAIEADRMAKLERANKMEQMGRQKAMSDIINANPPGEEGMTSEYMSRLQQKLGQAGFGREAMEMASKARTLGAQEQESQQERMHYNLASAAKWMSIGNSQATQYHLDEAFRGVPLNVQYEGKDAEGNYTVNMTNEDTGVSEKHSFGEDELRELASDPLKYFQMANQKAVEKRKMAELEVKAGKVGTEAEYKGRMAAVAEKNAETRAKEAETKRAHFERVDSIRKASGAKSNLIGNISPSLMEYMDEQERQGLHVPVPRSPASLAVLEAKAEMWKRDPYSAAGARADLKANTQALTKMQILQSNLTSFSKTADDNADLLMKSASKIAQTGFKLGNKTIRAIERQAGDKGIGEFDALLRSVKAEYAKLTSGNMGAVHVGVEREMDKILDGSATYEQLVSVINALKKEGHNRLKRNQEEIDSLSGKISKKNKVIKKEPQVPAAPAQEKTQRGGSSPADLF